MSKLAIPSLDIDEYLKAALARSDRIRGPELDRLLTRISDLPVPVRYICRGAPIAPFLTPETPRISTMRLSCRDFDHWLSRMNLWEYWPYMHREMLISFYGRGLAAVLAPWDFTTLVKTLSQVTERLATFVLTQRELLDPTSILLLDYTIGSLSSGKRLFEFVSVDETRSPGRKEAIIRAETEAVAGYLKLAEKMSDIDDESMLFSTYVLEEKRKNLAGGESVQRSFSGELNTPFLRWALPQLPDEKPFQWQTQLESESYLGVETATIEPYADELTINGSWRICLPGSPPDFLIKAAESFRARLKTRFEMDLEIETRDTAKGKKTIVLGTADELDAGTASLKHPKDYRILCRDGNILICGQGASGVMFGLFYLEYLFLQRGATGLQSDFELVRHSLFNTRMVMTSLGWMEWTEEYLALLPRYGIDAVFISPYANICGGERYRGIGPVQDPRRVRRLIDRIRQWGLKVYCQFINQGERYQEGPAQKINEDKTLVRLLNRFPDLDGLILLTEGYVADPETINRLAIRARAVKPELEILVWNYNGAISPENNREKVDFARRCSPDTIQMLTWAKGAKAEFDHEWRYVYDYTISVIGPSEVWALKQLENEKKKGVTNIYARADAWNNWQFGTLPYLPCPGQWLKRHDSLTDHGITGTLDSWTYGFTPNIMAEIKGIHSWDNAPDRNLTLLRIAAREFGEASAGDVVQAWILFSEAIRLVPDTGHGLLCNSCAQPIFLTEPPRRLWRTAEEEEKAGKTKYAVTLNAYWPYAPQWATFCPDFSSRRNIAEIYAKSYLDYFENKPGEKGFSLITFLKYLKKAAEKMEEGLVHYRAAAKNSPLSRRERAIRHVLIAEQMKNMLFSEAAILEAESCRMELVSFPAEPEKHIERIKTLVSEELARTKEFGAILEKDSRMGFELEADYFHTPFVIREKIALLESIETGKLAFF